MPMPPEKPRASPMALRVPSRPGARADLGRFVPSGRSMLVGLALLASCVGAYAGARETSMFAVRTIDVRGAGPEVTSEARAALRTELDTSLLKLEPAALERRLAAIPTIRSARLDRAFPHTLVVNLNPERSVAVVRRGAEGWLVSARGRVMRTVERGTLPFDQGGSAAAALGPLTGSAFARKVLLVEARADELTLVLRSGVELRLGDRGDLRLKLAIGQRILARFGAEAPRGSYIDVSVPERPVANVNPQVGG